jgi:hypothetical protein
MKKMFLIFAFGAMLISPCFADDKVEHEVFEKAEVEEAEKVNEEKEKVEKDGAVYSDQVQPECCPPEDKEEVKQNLLYSDPWAFLEDELLLVPGYASTFFSPLKAGGTLGALWALQKGVDFNGAKISVLRKYPEKFKKWFCSKFNWAFAGKNKGYEKLGGIVHSIMFILAGVAGYKLSGYLIDTLLYGNSLSSFLFNYPRQNRLMTPASLRDYFDREYERYVKGGFTYILTRTGKVIKFVKMAVKMHKKKISLKFDPDADE